MSQLSYAWEQAPVSEAPTASSTLWVEPPKRSIWQVILLCGPLMFATAGYFFGAPMLVDMSFLSLTLLMLIYLFGDLHRFSERFGIGGIVLFGGVLIWLCYDYLETWFLAWMPHWRMPIASDVVAKAAVFNMLYILCVVIGIRSRFAARLGRLITRLPEPSQPSNVFYYRRPHSDHRTFLLSFLRQGTVLSGNLARHVGRSNGARNRMDRGANGKRQLQLGRLRRSDAADR